MSPAPPKGPSRRPGGGKGKPDAAAFSLVVRPDEIGREPSTWTIEAAEDERAVLAARFGLIGIEAFRAELHLGWLPGHRFLRLWGRLGAAVTQQCGVTLQPVHNRIDEPFEILFVRPEGAGDEAAVALDDVEPLTGDELDIAEVAAEELALMLDPYPRAPGASLEKARTPSVGAGVENPAESSTGLKDAPASPRGNRPFEVLARLKRNK